MIQYKIRMTELQKKIYAAAKHRKFCLELTKKSIVLLKNEEFLPLSKEIKEILITVTDRDAGYSQ